MKKFIKKLLFLPAFLFPALCMAQGVSSVYDIFTQAEKDNTGYSCNAVRLNSNWFLTAAHCVDVCYWKNCTIKIDMKNGNVHTVAHTSSNRKVYIKSGFSQNSFAAKDDLALIKADNAGHSGSLTVLKFDAKDYVMTDNFSFAASSGMLGGQSEMFFSVKEGVGYVNDLQLWGGMSGGGVFDSRGYLVGIISGGGGMAAFPVFNRENYIFLLSAGSIQSKDLHQYGKVAEKK
ncbi:peptidase S1 and S6 chymotrypsin/Hap [Elusimicrobium minutum Pei191]|uniref:Peptidase S1 and S6 chymotrypsin/Hap n=1 Tax=Elusimicrobium minutum (strain Pei191) TaxID=445932 RepID=B2KDR1_ELUMP|nr:serine protease [Elusimicrobium minutum]ACC98657.1 peptidase S1 and S6 chymotrypsin/Hap [Elusimicrobium minutum Pei191]